MQLTKEQIEQFESDGYLIIEDLLSHEELEVLAQSCAADGFLSKRHLGQLAQELMLLIDTLSV